ncbi:helix-turn-helix domain-containing protein [Flectobacillus longus]|jgi:transcriptional regulator with XRE-family HTH domain|uniref:Helix-turn-helix transcriptional regulator n=1 Tax=Flectobacillus longus TaxID=2984207 RepID=A0ABT6YN07_9BACT|nr:helix-turn-helix transcriptional regulator [Flectobacillus longus]MDI9864960.1 helix-turn-helix transcriptional regulator [Flectobacillus longus]MDI9879904.1 helix-turn-helix transcriptional regulator [Flectobacillus longus]
MKRVEDRIRVLIAERGMTLLQLAIQSNITEATLHAILNRNDAKYSQLIRMARTLNVTVAYLMGESEIQNISDVQETQAGYVVLKTEEVLDMQRKIIELQAKLLAKLIESED